MSTLDATMAMLEAMPEDARIIVLEFTQQLFTSRKPSNPFFPLDMDTFDVIISPKALTQLNELDYQ